MTDLEIKQYLNKNNWKVKAQDFIMNVFNTSPQIIGVEYDSDTGEMTIRTYKNIFTFKWILDKPFG